MGTYLPSSDIDLSLIGDHISLSQLYLIEHEIDDLMMPYKVDLSVFNVIENTSLAEHIERVGRLFYEK